MALDYSIKPEDSVVRVRVTGSGDYLELEQLWREIAAECSAHRCLNILGESNTEAWTDGVPYDYPDIFRAAGITPQHRIAWIQHNPAAREGLEVAAVVVRNRKLASTRIFDSVAEAQRWLAATTG